MFNVTIDPGFDAKLGNVGKALNKAIVFTLTDSAKFANVDLLQALASKVDGPRRSR